MVPPKFCQSAIPWPTLGLSPTQGQRLHRRLSKARSQTPLSCPVLSPTTTRYLELKVTSALLLTTSTNLLSTSVPNTSPVSQVPAALSKCAAKLPSLSQSLSSKTTPSRTSQPDHTLVCRRPTSELTKKTHHRILRMMEVCLQSRAQSGLRARRARNGTQRQDRSRLHQRQEVLLEAGEKDRLGRGW